mmetsp:Transcript_16333/g.19956  ORF Transcript_16333/g.19956 Transcript_16333/m.19956 type:complete len:580 (-) Transcript_16333:284-2023(-)
MHCYHSITCFVDNQGLCLDTFWRSAENFSAERCQWAVSQAAPIRNIHITKELLIGDGPAYSSGGYVANAEVEGSTNFCANQQWYSRAVHFGGSASGGSWSTCYSGCTGNVPEDSADTFWLNGNEKQLTFHRATVEERPEVRVEKPFITMKKLGDEVAYELIVPSPTTDSDGVKGPKVDGQYSDSEIRSFSRVKVCKPILHFGTDEDGNENVYVDHDQQTYNKLTVEDEKLTNELQGALDEKKDLLLCPGLFFLTKPLIVKHPNQVLLGLGLATLIAPQDGSPCIRVEPNVPGVRIAGMTLEGSLQSGKYKSGLENVDGVRSLIDVGVPGVEDAGDPSNPVLLADIFTRVGGSNLVRKNVETDAMVRIHSGNVVGDNLWLWRADHVMLEPAGYNGRSDKEKPNDEKFPYYHQTRIWEKKDGKDVKVNECIVKNAIVVNGNDVKMYGLFCEHTTEHQCVWNGERGTVNFFQCEFPYDVAEDFAEGGFVGYYVNPNVKEHIGRGIGVYTNYQCFDVHSPYGIKVPDTPNVIIRNPFSVFLNNKGGIKNIIKVGEKTFGDSVKKNGDQLGAVTKRAWLGPFGM